MKSLYERLDEILIDPAAANGEWSSVRVFLAASLGAFILISMGDPEFRDPGAFVTIILTLIGAVVAPKILDVRMAIGKAAATIGSKFTKRTQTDEGGVESVQTEEEHISAVPPEPEDMRE